MIDLALITSPSPSPMAASAFEVASMPPLGVVYLAAMMRQKGYRVEIVDLNLRCCTPRYLRRFLAIKGPRLVGISTLTESYPNAMRIATMVKGFCRQIPVIVGGPHVTFTAQEALSHDCFDFVVCGEGELTLVELANCLLRGEGHLEDIPGLCWRRGENFFRNPSRPPLKELDGLPFPARNLLFLERYHKAGALITGRGCPGRCIFCSAGAMSGGWYRKRSPVEVVFELSFLRRLGVETFLFVDDSLTADLERLDRILFQMEREDLILPWVCESRVDVEEPGFFRRMAQAGCAGVQLGIESGSQEVLSQLNKGINLSQVIAAVEGAARAGINPLCSFMIGLPGDTVETVMETIQFAVELKREYYVQAGIAIATPFPGTRMSRDARRLGLRILEADYEQYNLYTPVMETRHLSTEQIRDLHFESVDRLRRVTKPGMGSLFPPPPDLREAQAYDFRRHLY